MRKILFILAVLSYGFHAHAEFQIKADTQKIDSGKVNKQITKLQLKLDDLKKQLIDTQNKLPIDSATLSTMLQQSHDAQVKSRKKSEKAVGGDVSDAKEAEKEAKDAAKQTQKAENDAKQVKEDRKKMKDLMKEIGKKQQQLNTLQGQ